ncbi:cadherin EGF LAG seven-pass G-type receptor 1-like isoform X2 [Dreissena polymorpha]|uniref:Uncharacterized protein n=1 Tax=Dreissena polymorpha TaxID=45954 RepID=A0A9D4GKY1_DREPO|nr:cadherin EGF LAG seven-pass G-type receptor 1-like isoform X2 [Dreissena polymorpha]KAH3819069.1 hypothetical protein DPMN_120799 [Dreissena polymorpha]
MGWKKFLLDFAALLYILYVPVVNCVEVTFDYKSFKEDETHVVFNASLGEGWVYNVAGITDIGDVFIMNYNSGVLYIRNNKDFCNNIHSNPLEIQILATYHINLKELTALNSTKLALAISFLNSPCGKSMQSSPLHNVQEKYSFEIVIFSKLFYTTQYLYCLNKDNSIIALKDFFPSVVKQNICDIQIQDRSNKDLYTLKTSSYEIVSTQDRCLYRPEMVIPTHLTMCGKNVLPLYAKVILRPFGFKSYDFLVVTTNSHSSRLKRQTRSSDPQFARSDYNTSIMENLPVGTPVITITATDPDSGDDGKLTYSLTAIRNTQSMDMFVINPISGQITTKQLLDREAIPVHMFYVTATDNSVFRKSAVATLTVTVNDENDITPTFDKQTYTVNKPENLPVNTVITTVRAMDGDLGENADIRYSIISPPSSTMFRIDPTSGSISTLKVLDRESQANYTLIVQAVDQATVGRQRSSTATIEITVNDENDNTPQFLQSSYAINVTENLDVSSKPVILQVSATDADEGLNKNIIYSISSGNPSNTFIIDPTTGQLSVQKPLDYETNTDFRLQIKASDQGQTAKSNITNVWIQVLDLNDNDPYFQSPGAVYRGSVLEGTPIGTSVLTVKALDSDSGENARLMYSLVDVQPDFPFAMDSVSGQISIRAPVDRELKASYSFTVEVKDNGKPPRSARASVEITINDINDNNPIFSPKTYSIVLPEDTPQYKQIIQVTATDADAQQFPTLTYQIQSGNNDQTFMISRENGWITLQKLLDYKTQTRYILTIRASDVDNKFDTAEVYINVSDINKHTPSFSYAPYTLSIEEELPVGTSIGQVTATDVDIGENGRISFTILSNVREFAIDPNSGVITTRESLDRELQAAYSFDVKASDHGNPPKSEVANVIVEVKDVNDNQPVFNPATYKAKVSEGDIGGALVTTVTATDKDWNINAQIRYQFQDGIEGSADFEIDPANGQIRIAKGKLDRERRSNYTLTVIAVDGGFRPLTGSAVVEIEVEDINDNAPIFSQGEINVMVPENQKIGSTIAVISAVDNDVGANALIQYSLEPGFDAEYFVLNQNKPTDPASIINKIDLDYEAEKNVYRFRLKASSGPLFGTTVVVVNVQDVNDNAPVLKDFTIIFNNYVDHFPSAPIGRIPAFDPDVSDKTRLNYVFTMGNEAGFLKLNESSGEITLDSRLNSDVPRNGTIQVKVSDSVNEVRATCRLQVRLVTFEMLQNSVTIRINNITSRVFLSPLFNFFVDALAAIINVEKSNIFVINIRSDTDVQAQILNITVAVRQKSVLKDRQLVDVFYSPEFLKEQIYLKRVLLANLSTLQILPFDDNLCLGEVCPYFEQCLSVQWFESAAPFITSETMLFRPIYPNSGYRCVCPAGFTRFDTYKYCDIEVNLCYSNPCNNSATCHSKEGGYSCECKQGFTGKHCEIDTTAKYENTACPSDACPAPSHCVPLIEGGYRCEGCPNSNHANQFCQLNTRSFQRGSFLTYPTMKSRNRFQIKLRFATQERNGLLFYNGRFNELHDFIALEIIDSQIQFSFSTGAEIVKVLPYVMGGVNDGKWHQVIVDYGNTTATVTVGENCETEIAVMYGAAINYTCAAVGSQTFAPDCAKEGNIFNCPKLLDLTGPLQVGGLPSLPSNFTVHNKDYVGCMRDFYIDNQLLDFNRFVENIETVAGCAAKEDFCKSGPCQHGGTCIEGWDSYHCQCPSMWAGKDCSQSIEAARRLTGGGFLTYQTELIPNVYLTWFNGISFRTRAENGTLLFLQSQDREKVHIEIKKGFIEYTYVNTISQTFRFDSVAVNDGEWHYFETRWLENGSMVMLLNYGQREKTVKLQSTLIGKKITSVYAGAIRLENSQTGNHFTGCIQNVRVGNTQNSVLTTVNASNALQGCSSGDACTASPCSPSAQCVNTWQGYTCQCPPGTLGPECKSICSNYNPCKNMATCRHPAGGSYVCECGQLQSGKYCETVVRECPKEWWGFPVCGPCPDNCTADNGFNPNCNKQTGECSCKSNYYRPPGSPICLPCNCYGHGSVGLACHAVTGQCTCIDGVIGHRCDTCPSKYAEIRQDEETQKYGCMVDYEACPRIFSHGMWWDTEVANVAVPHECPNRAVGQAVRNCSQDGLWQDPDFFNCTNLQFLDHQRQIEKIETGALEINTFVARTLLKSLGNSTTTTDTMFGNDINITLRILNRVLDYENKQSGLNLTSERDSHYLYNLLSVLSDVLQSRYSKEWERLSQNGQGTGEVILKMELYLGTLLSALELTSKESPTPYNVITENIVLSVDYISKTNFSGKTIPKFNNIVRAPMFDEDTNIFLPKSLLSDQVMRDFLQPEINIAPKAFVGYILYKDLGDLLPKQFASNVKVLDGRPLSINSPVFTVIVRENGKNVTVKPSDPVVITFRQLMSANRTRPQCAAWLYKPDGTGEWATDGCSVQERYTMEDTVFVKCACDHMTSYAVIMDVSEHEYVPSEPITVQIVTYIGLVICMGCLALTFLVLFIPKRVQCNANSIHINLMFVMFVCQLAFLIGINRTDSGLFCRLVGIALHYFYMTGFTWLFVDILHLYRMLTEIRNIDSGSMKFYYLLAYVIPGIIVSLAVGLNTEGYGTGNFCWLSMKDKFIWSFAGPVTVSIIVSVFIFALAMKASCREKVTVADIAPYRVGMLANILLLLLWGVIWVTGLLSVNYDHMALHFVFALFCLALGVFTFIMYIVVNYKVRHELKKAWYKCRGHKLDLDDNIGGTRSSVYSRSALAYRNDTCEGGTLNRINVGISTNSTTSRSTSKSSGGLYKGEDYLRSTSTSTSGNAPATKYPKGGPIPGYGYDFENPDGLDPDSMQIPSKREGNDSDSESEMSERMSLDLASSHSSDDDDDIDVQLSWENQLPKNKKIEEAREQIRKQKEEMLQQQQQKQQQQPPPVIPTSTHQYHNPFEHHLYSGSPSPQFPPRLPGPVQWPGDPQLSGYTGSESEYHSSDQPTTLSSNQPDVTLQTPEYKGREFKIATARHVETLQSEALSSGGGPSARSPLGSPQTKHTPQVAPGSPISALGSPFMGPLDEGREKVKVLTHRGSVSSDSEWSHETCV